MKTSIQKNLNMTLRINVYLDPREKTWRALVCFTEGNRKRVIKFFLHEIQVMQASALENGWSATTLLSQTQAEKISALMSMSADKFIGVDFDKNVVVKIDFGVVERNNEDRLKVENEERNTGYYCFGFRDPNDY